MALWLNKFSSLGILENLNVSILRKNSYSDSSVNSKVETLWEYSIFVQKCEAILNNVLGVL